jgi:hypothetical protein
MLKKLKASLGNDFNTRQGKVKTTRRFIYSYPNKISKQQAPINRGSKFH